jgi:hypothetical protein
MVLVIAVPAEGAMTLAIMLYFAPSIASVRVRPVIPALAVEYWKSESTTLINASPKKSFIRVFTFA